MLNIYHVIPGVFLVALTLFTLSFFISSVNEKEKRAVLMSLILLIFLLQKFFVFNSLVTGSIFSKEFGTFLLTISSFIILILLILHIVPFGSNKSALKGTRGLITGEPLRIDERTTVFSKITQEAMESGESGAKSVFEEKGKIDGDGGKTNVIMGYASSHFARKLANPETLCPEVASELLVMDPDLASKRIKGFAKRLGACLVGVTELNPLWLYSHYGRSGVHTDEWAKEVTTKYKYAIVIATEMDFKIISAAPHTPTIMESLSNYAKGAVIASQVAQFIADMGYPSKVNQMAHYDAMMVPLAIDAGLGELSRMGYLITKDYGPRVRLAAVLTDIPITTDKPADIGVLDFCQRCKKCATNCPSGSISKEDRIEENGSLRWIIDRESCFKYWQHVGTDCCICMRVCPFSHPRSFPHKVVAEMVTRNQASRRTFNWMDDVLYGRKPKAGGGPDWVKWK